MKKIVDVRTISREEWLAYRKKGITGSDAGAIIGVNPYSSPFRVYQDKISEEISSFDNEAMRQGRDLEDYVARRFCEETGYKVRRANYIYTHSKYPFIMGNFDRMIVGINCGLECKTVSPYSADKWKDGKIPLHYQLQCQHYLAVSGFNSWYIAALILGRELIIRKIERDEEIIRNLITLESRFWTENVLKRQVPLPDGSSDYSAMLQKLYPKGKEEEVDLTMVDSELIRRGEILELEEKLKRERENIDQQIKLIMGESTLGKTGDYVVSWKNANSSRLETKRLKEEQPKLYEEYCKEISTRRFTVKRELRESA